MVLPDSEPTRAPASRDGFFHDGHKFYVLVDNKHEHTRCDATTLYGLLTTPTNRDRPAHFYTAQMMHYGMQPPMKTRDPAKRKLLAAFAVNEGTIHVPANVLKLEKELEKEYRGTQKANKQPPKAPPPRAAQPPMAVTPAKDYLWGAELRSCLEGFSQKDLVDLLMRIAGDDKSDEATEINKKLWKLRGHDPDVARPQASAERSKPARTKQTARRSAPIFGLSRTDSAARQSWAVGSSYSITRPGPVQPSRTKQTARRGGRPPPPPRIHVPANAPFRPIGTYNIEAHGFTVLDKCFKTEEMYVEIHPSSTGAHLWGRFDFEAVRGIFRSTGRVPTSAGDPISFAWRGQESCILEGNMRIGSWQTGYIKFLPGGSIEGRMDGFDAQGDFTGGLVVGDVDITEVRDWKREWRRFNEAVLNAQSAKMWDAARAMDPEKPSASDTSGGEDDSMDIDSNDEDEEDW